MVDLRNCIIETIIKFGVDQVRQCISVPRSSEHSDENDFCVASPNCTRFDFQQIHSFTAKSYIYLPHQLVNQFHEDNLVLAEQKGCIQVRDNVSVQNHHKILQQLCIHLVDFLNQYVDNSAHSRSICIISIEQHGCI